jgi:hypothetical protein
MTDDSHENVTDLKIKLIQRDVDRLGSLFDKLDVTIDKLTQVANGIERMLAVHENRLGQQEEASRQILVLMEDRRHDVNERFEKVQRDISTTRNAIEAGFTEKLAGVEKKIDKISSIVDKLNIWKYTVIGGAMVLGFLLSKVPLNFLFN